MKEGVKVDISNLFGQDETPFQELRTAKDNTEVDRIMHARAGQEHTKVAG